MTHYNLVHKFIPVAQAIKNPDAKQAVAKELEAARNNSSMATGESPEQEGGYSRSTKRQKESPLCFIDDICYPENAELEPKLQKYQGRVVLRGDIVKDDSGAHAVFTEQGSSASQKTAAKVMDVIARLPDCDGQAADAVSAYIQVTQVAQNSQVGMSRRTDTSSTTQMA